MNDIFQDFIAEAVKNTTGSPALEHLCQHQLYFKPEKCKFEQTWIEYLGLIILHGAVEMDLVKVAGMVEWLKPKNKKEVQALLGFANFY
ncbi:hypothetical protein E4T56_gene18952 [Termitomyces sp. T112]|nr:hypothetical protein E4T56_gene18952 [Termitomyces sp. T112]